MKSFKLASLLIIITMLFVVNINAVMAQKVNKDESLRKGETRVTLDPNMFTDPRIKKAYQAAKEIPWVLDSIYCYCFCKESPAFKHKSLLSCHVDNHSAM